MKTTSAILAKYWVSKGFSVQNLRYRWQIYREYHDSKKLQPQVGEIRWSHNPVIMLRCEELLEREFCFRMTCMLGWMLRVSTSLKILRNHQEGKPLTSFRGLALFARETLSTPAFIHSRKVRCPGAAPTPRCRVARAHRCRAAKISEVLGSERLAQHVRETGRAHPRVCATYHCTISTA